MPNTHDLGGKSEFFGLIAHPPNEPVFHAEWERRMFGINFFLQTLLGPDLDTFRGHLAHLPPEEYFPTYYGRWIPGIERMYAEYLSGERSVPKLKVAGTAQFLRKVALRPTLPKVMNAKVSPKIIGTHKKTKRPPRFAIGNEVRVRPAPAEGHSQQPEYVSGRLGRVVDHRGAAILPDRRFATGSTEPEHLYIVMFDGVELWGDAAEPNTEVRIELFETYLEPV